MAAPQPATTNLADAGAPPPANTGAVPWERATGTTTAAPPTHGDYKQGASAQTTAAPTTQAGGKTAAGASLGSKIKGAFGVAHGMGEVIRGNINDMLDQAGDAVAQRPHGSVASRTSGSQPTHPPPTNGMATATSTTTNPHPTSSTGATAQPATGAAANEAHQASPTPARAEPGEAGVAARGLDELNRGLEKVTGRPGTVGTAPVANSTDTAAAGATTDRGTNEVAAGTAGTDVKASGAPGQTTAAPPPLPARR